MDNDNILMTVVFFIFVVWTSGALFLGCHAGEENARIVSCISACRQMEAELLSRTEEPPTCICSNNVVLSYEPYRSWVPREPGSSVATPSVEVPHP